MVVPEVRVFTQTSELAAEAADLFIWFGQQAIASDGRFQVALSGGSTPRALYEALTREDLARQLDWRSTEFFFGDERCVPPDHPESNYRLAFDSLFRPLGIPESRVFRMEGELPSVEEAARRYEGMLRQRLNAPAPAWPRFHVILLGLGEDGHTASLFPGTPAVGERTRLVVPSSSPKGVAQRMTFTVPLINEAAAVMFLITGTGKASPVRDLIEPVRTEHTRYPAGLIRPRAGRLLWLLDHAAGAQLTVAKQQIMSHEE